MQTSRCGQWILLLVVLIASVGCWQIFHPELPTAAAPIHLYASSLGDDPRRVLIHAIAQARRSITLQIYALSDQKIFQALQQKAQQGVAVKVFYDPHGSARLNKQRLTPVRFFPVRLTGGLMHRKVLLIDRQRLFLGSTNLTTTSLLFHHNLLIGCYHPPLAEFLSCGQQASSRFALPQQSGAVWLLPAASKAALQSLIHALEQAQRKICVAMFTLTHRQLIAALIAAQRRGLQVEVYLQRWGEQGTAAHQQLAAAGVHVYHLRGAELLHHKFAWIDQQALWTGSANWTAAAFTKNLDLLITIAPLDAAQQRKMARLCRKMRWESRRLPKKSATLCRENATALR